MARKGKGKVPANRPLDLPDLFTSSLRLEPDGLCVAGLASCCERLFKPHSPPRSSKFLRAGMQFLGGDRTFDEHHAMTASIAQCRCNLKDTSIAELHKPVSTIDPLNFTILELSFALMDALNPKGAPPAEDHSGKDLDQVVLAMEDWNILNEAEDQLGPLPADWVLPPELVPEEATPTPEEEPWPSGPADVFPSTQGLGQTLQNLLLWTAEPCGGSGLFLLLSRLSDYAPEFAAEVASAPLAVPCALVHLEQALDRFEAHAPPETFRLAIAATTHFLHHLDPRRIVRHLFRLSDLFLSLAARVQPALAQMPGPEAAFAKAWWAVLRRGVDAGPSYPWHQFGRPEFAFAEFPPAPADGARLFRMLSAHRARTVCKKPDCAHRSAKTLMFCRRCAIACYCSATCQKQAWGKGDVPHKALCNGVDALRRATGLEKDDVLWREVLIKAAPLGENIFAQLCETKGVEAALRESIANELRQHDTAMWAASGS